MEGLRTVTLSPPPFLLGSHGAFMRYSLWGLLLLLQGLPVTLQNCRQLSLAEPLPHHYHLWSWDQACTLAPK